MKKDKIHPLDEKYLRSFKPDPDFNPEHNRSVIDQVIKDTDANIRAKGREHDQDYQERSEAAAHYLKSLQQGNTSKDVEKYFGRRHLAYLRGQEVMGRIKEKIKGATKLSEN
jgi:hypothetical protein